MRKIDAVCWFIAGANTMAALYNTIDSHTLLAIASAFFAAINGFLGYRALTKPGEGH